VQLAGDALALFFLGGDDLAQQLAAQALFVVQFGIQPDVLDGDCDVAADGGQEVLLVPVELARGAGADTHAAEGAAVGHEGDVYEGAEVLEVDGLVALAAVALDVGDDDELLAVDDAAAGAVGEPELLDEACCALRKPVVDQ